MRNAEEEAHPVTRCEGVRLVQRSDGLLRMSGHTPRHRHSQTKDLGLQWTLGLTSTQAALRA